MGIRDFLRSKFSSAYEKRMDVAADQLWRALMTNRTIEIPAVQSTDNDVMNAVLRLREKYPQVGFTMLQSKSIVLTRELRAVSKEAFDVLDSANYFPDQKLPADLFFDMHQEFMVRNARVDPKVVELEALEAQRKHDAIMVGAVGTASVTPEAVPAAPAAPVPMDAVSAPPTAK